MNLEDMPRLSLADLLNLENMARDTQDRAVHERLMPVINWLMANGITHLDSLAVVPLQILPLRQNAIGEVSAGLKGDMSAKLAALAKVNDLDMPATAVRPLRDDESQWVRSVAITVLINMPDAVEADIKPRDTDNKAVRLLADVCLSRFRKARLENLNAIKNFVADAPDPVLTDLLTWVSIQEAEPWHPRDIPGDGAAAQPLDHTQEFRARENFEGGD